MKKSSFKKSIYEFKKYFEGVGNKSLYKENSNQFFRNLKDKVSSFYSAEGSDLDKDIFINSDQRLLKIASSIIVLTSFLGIGWLAIAKTDEIISIITTAMILSLLATIYPSWLAAKKQPDEALRYE